MKQHDDGINLFGHRVIWQDIFTVTLLLAAFMTAIAGIIGNNTLLYMSSILFLLSTFVLYMFFFMRQSEKKLNDLSNVVGTVNTLEKLDALTKTLSTLNSQKRNLISC